MLSGFKSVVSESGPHFSAAQLGKHTGMDDVTFRVEIIKGLEYFLDDYFEYFRGHHTILPSLGIFFQRLT